MVGDSTMPYGKGTYGSKVGRPPYPRRQKRQQLRKSLRNSLTFLVNYGIILL